MKSMTILHQSSLHHLLVISLCTVALANLSACESDSSELEIGASESLLTASERRDRAALIRDSAAAYGLTNGVLLAGVADVETAMSHCWSELTWACKGPNSPSCGGGPVAAGAWDGECWEEKGGLGMFQFDAGRFDDTLAAYGSDVLTIEGNVRHAVDYVVNMIARRSNYLPDMTDEEALAWLNRLRPWHPEWELWAKTLTRHYNGCPESGSCWAPRLPKYRNAGINLYKEMGAEFWYGPGETCEFLPAEGGAIDDTSGCFAASGQLSAWTNAGSGKQGGHAQLAANADATGVWTVKLSEASQYRVEIFVPANGGGSAGVDYEVVHANGSSSVTVPQTEGGQFVELGTYYFERGQSYAVRINSVTMDAKPASADTIRLTRVENPVDTQGSTATDSNAGESTTVPANPDAPSPGVAVPAGLQSSCRLDTSNAPSPVTALLVALGSLVVRRRKHAR